MIIYLVVCVMWHTDNLQFTSEEKVVLLITQNALQPLRHFWIILAVIAAIVLIAVILAGTCCKRGGNFTAGGPYTYLPGMIPGFIVKLLIFFYLHVITAWQIYSSFKSRHISFKKLLRFLSSCVLRCYFNWAFHKVYWRRTFSCSTPIY